MNAEKMTDCAEEWIKKNPVAWSKMVVIANDMYNHNRHFSISLLAEEARYYMRVNGIDQFKINNSIRAALARRLITDNPYLEGFIETRKSKIDERIAQ